MFQHLFAGSPPWLIAAATLGVVVHVGAGGVGIVSGAAALWFRKGERLHRLFGNLFFVAMLTMAVMATSLASVLVSRGHSTQWGNVFGGFFTFYLVSTAWVTVRRPEGTIGRFEVAGLFLAVAVAAVALLGLLPITASRAGRESGVPIAAPIIIALVASLAAGLDLKVVLRGGVTGVGRIARHVWRMCAGLFIASGSFFLGQQKVMPAFIQGSPVLILLGVAPLLAMIFWLIRIRQRSAGFVGVQSAAAG